MRLGGKPRSRDEAFAARKALSDSVKMAELPWSRGVKTIRLALGMTQTQFAKAFKLTVRQVSQFENGSANPTVETLTRIGMPFGFAVGFVPAPAQSAQPAAKRPAPKAEE